MISLNIHMMTSQVLVWLFFIMTVFCVPHLLWCLCHFIMCISRNMSFYPSVQRFCLSPNLFMHDLWHTGPVSMFIHSFRQYQIILLCYRLNGLLEGFYIQQRCDPELTPCQRELKFDVLPVTPPRYVTRLYVCRKNIWQVYQTENSILWDRFALPNTTRDSDHCWLRIYEWIPYRQTL